MAGLFKLFKSPTSRKVLTSSLEASAAATTPLTSAPPVPSSATFLTLPDVSASIEASQATSAALSELSKHLDSCLSEIDFDGDLSGQRRMIERRLTTESEKYPNCRLGGTVWKEGDLEELQWRYDKAEAEMVSIAMKLSDTAYDAEREPEPEKGFKFERKEYIPASVNGTTKATTFTIVTPVEEADDPENNSNNSEKYKEGYPLLVIGIKGSRSPADWMVNSNGTPREVGSEFLNLSGLGLSSAANKPAAIKSHSGFFHCASALLPQMTKSLVTNIKDSSIRNVLFTGHSAGGATASLLFTHFLCRANKEYKNIKFNLITFGAPPVVNTPELSHMISSVKSSNKGHFLAICNEHDPVPRADAEYIRSLLDLHRSAYGLPPLPEEGAAANEPSSNINPTEENPINNGAVAPPPSMRKAPSEFSLSQISSTNTASLRLRRRVTEAGEWNVPAPVLYPVGRIIVLNDRNTDKEGLNLYAFEVDVERFQKLLFVKVGAHRRGVYLENVEELRSGRVNGFEDVWESRQREEED